jgi:hypothetical protein
VQTAVDRVALAVIALSAGEFSRVETWVGGILLRAADIHVLRVLDVRVAGAGFAGTLVAAAFIVVAAAFVTATALISAAAAFVTATALISAAAAFVTATALISAAAAFVTAPAFSAAGAAFSANGIARGKHK